jgi:hypothetical protein
VQAWEQALLQRQQVLLRERQQRQLGRQQVQLQQVLEQQERLQRVLEQQQVLVPQQALLLFCRKRSKQQRPTS